VYQGVDPTTPVLSAGQIADIMSGTATPQNQFTIVWLTFGLAVGNTFNAGTATVLFPSDATYSYDNLDPTHCPPAPVPDPCQPNPCSNSAQCTAQSGGTAFTCACLAGWDGVLCDHNIDDCAANPCGNGMVCVDGVNTYTCQNGMLLRAVCRLCFACN
jgi:hypothetical protein